MDTVEAAPTATDLFLSLTPERVWEAVEEGGVPCRAVCYPLNSFENRVYEVELVDGSRVVAKFYRPGRWSREQLLEEHAFLDDLHAAEIPVVPPRRFPDGSTLKRIEHIWFSLFDRRGGRAPDELDDAALQRLGMLVGRLHDVGARGSAVHRIRLTSQVYARDDLAWLADHGVVPERLRERYHDAARAVADRYDELAAGTAEHRLHGDLHLGNVLLRDGRLRLVDFDDMMVGPAVQDLWLAVPGRDAESLRQREVLLEGYEQFRLFDRSTFRLVEPLRGLRMIHYAAWLARRWHDPIFQATWSDFGTEPWWEREVEDLEEQLRVIRREAAGPGVTADEEQALTNRDYFWDWDEN